VKAARPLRVLIISLYHPELVRGGSQQVSYELFQELGTRDDVVAVLLASAGEDNAAIFSSGATITGFDGRPNE